MQFYEKIKNKIRATAEAIITGDETILFEIDRYFAEQSVPSNFDEGDVNNAIIITDKHFETLCALLESHGVSNASQLSVLSFYVRLEYFKNNNLSIKNLK